MSEKLKGRESPRKGKTASLEEKIKKSKPLIYQGVQYFGLSEATRQTGKTAYFIKTDPTFSWISI
jgi:hypothetical protein